jgi:hypothetical protein
MRTLIIFLLLAGGLSSHAYSRTVLVQDSVKKVTIRVIASEKPKEVDFDTLINTGKAEARARLKTSQSLSKRVTASRAGITERKEALNKSSVPKQTSSKPAKIKPVTGEASVTKQSSNNKHKEELDKAQVTDDKTAIEPTDIKTSRTYLWIGFMLIVVGVILGILFGKTALLISIAGIVFVVIGYSL